MTTLARLAKVIKGYCPPVGWIERAFAGIMTAIGSVLPTYTIGDENKVLTVGKDEGHIIYPIVVDQQSVTLNGTSKGRLAEGTWHLFGLLDNTEVTLFLDNTPVNGVIIGGGIWDINGDYTLISSSGIVNLASLEGYANKTITIFCNRQAVEYNPILEWDSVNALPPVGENDKNKYLHTNASTGAVEWSGIEIPEDNLFVVSFRVNEGRPDYLTCDQTLAEITAALAEGKFVYAKVFNHLGNDTEQRYILNQEASDGYRFTSGVYVTSASVSAKSISYTSTAIEQYEAIITTTQIQRIY